MTPYPVVSRTQPRRTPRPPRPRHQWQLVLMQDGEPAYWNRSLYVPAGRSRPLMEMIELVFVEKMRRRWSRGDVMRYYPIR